MYFIFIMRLSDFSTNATLRSQVGVQVEACRERDYGLRLSSKAVVLKFYGLSFLIKLSYKHGHLEFDPMDPFCFMVIIR